VQRVERILNTLRDCGDMNGLPDIDLDALLDEIARYLAAVDAFRAAACEPTWRPEPVAAASAGTSRRSSR
jgi:hypothetical protein